MNGFSFLSIFFIFCLLFSLVACNPKEDEAPAMPYSGGLTVTNLYGDNQIALPFQYLDKSISAWVRDTQGSGQANVAVRFRVVQGGGFVSDSLVHTDDARVASTAWMVGGSNSQILEAVVIHGYEGSGEISSSYMAQIAINDCPEAVDADGNRYPVVQIGNQCWIAENLRTGSFQNGDEVPNLEEADQWAATTLPAGAYYDNDPDLPQLFGRLYNWYAVIDSRELCPQGFRVPNTVDFDQLADHLGGKAVAGGKMKIPGTAYWNIPNSNATNESGFSAVGGSYRHLDGNYYDFGRLAAFWTADFSPNGNSWMRFLYHDQANMVTMGSFHNTGLSVRCIAE